MLQIKVCAQIPLRRKPIKLLKELVPELITEKHTYLHLLITQPFLRLDIHLQITSILMDSKAGGNEFVI